MCGIAGIYNFRSGRPVDDDALKSMGDVMWYRGPDDEGIYKDGPLGLSHRRLSIIDLEGGHQPMPNQDRSVWICYNGEVYNYRELAAELRARGCRFSTSSDTEVLIHAYQEYGTAMLGRLNGMFAFILWDKKTRRLFIARDRFGIKPLYYAETPDGLIFGSEIKALFASGLLSPAIENRSIYRYMRLGFVSGERTMFRSIKKLLPGHYLICEEGQLRIARYWDLRFHEKDGIDERAWCEELLARLRESVRLTLRSDVPLGVFLSGGIDSSMVVALLSSMVDKPIKTFSVAYNMGPRYDEFSYARLVAKRFSTDHHELYMEPGCFKDFIPQYVRYMDDPVTEAAGISLFFLSKYARQYVKVMLSGEGADEIFAGYPIYRRMGILEVYSRLASAMAHKVLIPLFQSLPIGHKLGKYIHLAGLPLEKRYSGVHLYDPRLIEQLMQTDFKQESGAGDFEEELCNLYRTVQGETYLNRMLYVDTKWWLPDDILIKADRMSMANSLELRPPFLDHTLVEFVATMPTSLKLRGSVTKYIQKKAAEKILPREVVWRAKMGFPTPLDLMFRTELKGYVRELLLSQDFDSRGYFDRKKVERLFQEHASGRSSNQMVLWQLIVLEEWHRAFIDGSSSTKDSLAGRRQVTGTIHASLNRPSVVG